MAYLKQSLPRHVCSLVPLKSQSHLASPCYLLSKKHFVTLDLCEEFGGRGYILVINKVAQTNS